jgi:nucleoside-diphosphate-sugar epimerase
MPRVLIVGCGYVGRATADLFHANGWQVAAWRRSGDDSSAPYPIVSCDATDASSVAAHASESDVVVQTTSTKGGDADAYRKVYLDTAKNLAANFPSALLLFASSTSVYAQRNGEWVTEESPAEPDRATSRVLRETEELVLASGGIVARLAGIYGPGRSFLLEQFLSGRATIPATDRYLNQVHRDDIATALFLLASKPEPAQIFNVADDAPMLRRECYEWLARHLEKPLPAITTESQPRKRGDSNKRVSNRKLHDYGWQLRYPRFETGMAESVIPHWNASCSAGSHAQHQT